MDIMALTPLFILLTLCQGTIAQVVVTQESSLSVIPGGTISMTCRSSTEAVKSAQSAHWFQQKSGQVPRLLIYNTKSLLPGVPARFSGALTGDQAALTISGVQLEDEADCYWALQYDSSSTVRDLDKELRQKRCCAQPVPNCRGYFEICQISSFWYDLGVFPHSP